MSDKKVVKDNIRYKWGKTGYYLLLCDGNIHIVHSKYIIEYAYTENCDVHELVDIWKTQYTNLATAFVVMHLDFYSIKNIRNIISGAKKPPHSMICCFDKNKSEILACEPKYIVEAPHDPSRSDMEIDETTYSTLQSPNDKYKEVKFEVKHLIDIDKQEVRTEEVHRVITEGNIVNIKERTVQNDPKADIVFENEEYLILYARFYSEKFFLMSAEETLKSLEESSKRFDDFYKKSEKEKAEDEEFGKLSVSNQIKIKQQYSDFSKMTLDDKKKYCMLLNTSQLPIVYLKISRQLLPSNSDWWSTFLDEKYEPKDLELKKYDSEIMGGNSSKNKRKIKSKKRKSKRLTKTKRRKYNHTI